MKLISKIKGESQEEKEECCPKLSMKERVTGFAVCFILGLALELVSFGSFASLIAGKPQKFAILYTLGNIIALTGTCFLSGPKSQFKSMTDKTRLITTIVYILSIIMTLVSAIIIKKAWLVIIFIVIQQISYFWYSLSFIPFARTIIKGWFKSILK